MEQLNLLREHNKDLVKRLKLEKRAFERLSGRYDAEAMRAEFQVLTGEELSSAGATSAKPSVRFAGVLDIEDSVIERSDEFFSDLCLFRSLNKSECVHSSRTELSETPLGLSALNDEGNPEVNLDTHQCAFWYRMNSRLFPVSLHTECCIVCKKHKTSHPHTLKNPALVRVSIPRAAVLPPYKFRAHRRRSFNTDSLGLPSHCLAGWSNRSQNTLAAPSSLDLRSNVNEKEVRSLPYLADQNCLNPATEYKLDGSNLCCKKCQPGQYIESPNYSPNCFPCKKCKISKGLQYIQNCSAQTMSKCGCRPNMFCQVGSKDCSSCARYRSCNVGYGVSKPGTVNSDVRCEPCPEGTFSDKDSSTDPCQPHQSCQGRVIRAGNATANTVCKPSESFPISAKVFATSTTASAATPAVVTPSVSPPAPEAFFNQPTKSPLPSSMSDKNLALIICIPVILLLLVSAIVLFCWSTVCRKGAGKCHPEVDANGNCGPAEKMKPGYFQETQLISLNMTSPEQECLLEKSEPSTSDHSHSSRSTDVLTRTENGSSSESIGPLHSTLPLHDLHSEESMNLFFSKEVLPPQNSVHAQSSSQPATPQIISPVTSPQVNVNITFHIGNSSGSTPKVSPTDLKVDPQLPFGAEEEALGILQQEAGKQFMTSVQESAG
ncbi:hypothetical protein D4764_04G0006040 [Takifugu flavidus]|uniref:TNFR-Cys domain-containing protein n=1 Tax=Takifugu flavidus TaxID=433684 RepID=A0A5C6N8G1_9TELE|nr:hypothetical protein D4764_04G0006040 [Takifugu flavidus]